MVATTADTNDDVPSDEQNDEYDWDGRIGDTMRRAVKNTARRAWPSMHQLAIQVGPHGSTDYGYQTVHRCIDRGLIALDPDHPDAAPNGRGAVVLTDKGWAYYNHITGDEDGR